MPTKEKKAKFTDILSPSAKERIEKAREEYIKIPEENEYQKTAALRALLITTLITYRAVMNNDADTLNRDSVFSEAFMNEPVEAVGDIINHYTKKNDNDEYAAGKPEELLELIDYDVKTLNQMYERCKVVGVVDDPKYKFNTNKDILIAERDLQDDLKTYDEGEKNISKMAQSANVLLEELEAIPQNQRTANYGKMKEVLTNFAKFGTTEFKYGEDGQLKKATENDKTHPQIAIRALNQLFNASQDLYAENPKLALKVAGTAWALSKEHSAYLNMDPSRYKGRTQRDLETIAEEKQARKIENASVNDKQQYVRRMTQDMDMFRDALQQHSNGKLSWFRGSPQYRDVGRQLRNVHRLWNDMLQKENALNNKGKEPSFNELKELKESIEAVQREVETLKEKNMDYFNHKVEDGQFSHGTNKNADKRIAVVENINKFTDHLLDTIKMRRGMAANEIQAFNSKHQPKKDEIKLDILPENNSVNLINANNDLASFFEPKPGEEIIKEEPEINNIINTENKIDDSLIIKEEPIKEEPKKLTKEDIINEPTDEVFKIPSHEEAVKRARELLERKRKEAQKNIENKYANGGNKVPDKEEMRQNYAAITTSLNLEASLNRTEKRQEVNLIAAENVTEQLFNSYLLSTMRGKPFKQMMNKSDDKTLFNQAIFEKGQNLYANYDEQKRNLEPEKKGNRTAINGTKKTEIKLGNN